MLIEIDYKNKSKSKYFCDICGKRFNNNQITKIYENNKKIYDLCSNCKKLIKNTISNFSYEKGGQIIK